MAPAYGAFRVKVLRPGTQSAAGLLDHRQLDSFRSARPCRRRRARPCPVGSPEPCRVGV